MIEVSDWQELGTLGMVTATLFLILITGFKLFMKHIEKQHLSYKELTLSERERYSQNFQKLHDQHNQSSQRIQDQHREDRKDWSKDTEKRDIKYEMSIKEFTQAITTLKDNLRP